MTRWISRTDAVQASVFTSLGALMLFGALSFPLAGPIVAVGLIVLAILVFTHTVQGPTWLAATLLGIAALMLITNPVGRFLSGLMVTSLQVVAGGLLIALGIMKLAGHAPIPKARRPTTSGSARVVLQPPQKNRKHTKETP